MYKKLITACMAIAAFAAFVVPATASATNDPQVTSGGVLLATPANVSGTLSGNSVFYNTATTIEQVVCNSATLTGTLTKNTASTVEGEIKTALFQGTGASFDGRPECTGTFGSSAITVLNLPLLVKSGAAQATDEFTVTGAAGANLKFLINSTTAGECEYEAATSVKGDYTTNGTVATLTTRDTAAGSGASLKKGGFLCPSSGMLKMSFTLEKTGGGNLTIS